MNQAFRAYKEAQAVAQAEADKYGLDYGLEYNRLTKEYVIFMLPDEKNRYGHELRCEVVHTTKPRR